MKYVLIPLLFLGLIPFVFAEEYRGETTLTGTTQDGKQILGNGLTPWIFDGETYQPFLFTDGSTKTIETNYGSVVLNADGSYSFYKKGNINETELFTDEIVAKYADVSDLNSWTYLNGLNNDTPDVSWDGVELVSKKTSAAGILEYKYILNDGKWKTQLEATNLSALTTKAFGFDQIIDINSDTIKFGGVTRNLDNFDGQTFSKQFLIDNEGKVLDLLNGFNFDFDLGFENLHSITVYDTGIGKSRLVFDYRTTSPLLPNETLIIDPTITQTTGGDFANVFGATQYASGEKLETASAQLIGATLDTVDWWLKKSGSPTGTGTARIYNGAGTLQETSTNSLDVSTLTGTSTQTSFTFAGTHTLAENDRIVFYFSGGDGSNFVQFEHSTTDVYDSTNSIRTRFASSAWDDSSTTTDAKFIIVYDSIPAPYSITDLTADTVGTTTASLSFTPPNLNGETLINYMLNVTTPQASPVTTFWMNGTMSTFSVVGLTQGTDYSASASAYTAGGGNWTLANILNFTTIEPPDGTFTVENGNVGDTLKINGTLTLSSANPLPANATALKLYKDNVLVKTDTIFDSIPSLGSGVVLDNLWYQITDSLSHQYALVVTVNNDAGSVDIMGSPNATVTREYNPDYFPAVDNPSVQGSVNATIERFDDEDGILLKVNRIGVSTGATWQIECISQTNSEAAQTKDETQSWLGDWSNETNTGYFNTTYTGYTNSHAYITCFNEDELFSLTSFTNSSLALLGIQLFDDSYGAMLGVPVGVFFLVMTAGMANKRTAPTFIIVITGIAGTMATIGFFSFEPLVWGLALVTAMLGIFVNQKIF